MKNINLFLVSIALVVHCDAQVKSSISLPNTPAGLRLKEWLKVFASGNQKNFTTFIGNNFVQTLLDETSAHFRAERIARTFVDARNFEIVAIESSTDYEIVTLARAELTGFWFRLRMKLQPEPPHRIVEYRSQRIQTPVNFQKKRTESQLKAEVKAFLEKMAKADAFSGTVLIARDNKIIFKTVHGFANKAYSILNEFDTKFNIASIGKMFTTVAIFQLLEKGKLLLTDTIKKFLPDYPNKQVSSSVTIHHLLSHTSGLGDFHGEKFICTKGTLREVKDWFPLFDSDSLQFKPGEKWQYSNAGFIILGAIIEKLSGENYFDYIRTHIFNPSGMRNTDYYEADMDVPRMATGYTNFKDLGKDFFEFHIGTRRNTSLYSAAKGNPQGGASSTIEDLLKFSISLKGNKLISEESFKKMSSTKIFARKFDTGDTYWGYGMELESLNGQRVMGHGGGDIGVSAALRMYPDSGNYTVVVLSNYDRGGILTIVKLQELITEK